MSVSTSSGYSGNSRWRLRSAGYRSNDTCRVYDGGYVYDDCDADFTDDGVRAALQLNLNSDIFQSSVSETGKGNGSGCGEAEMYADDFLFYGDPTVYSKYLAINGTYYCEAANHEESDKIKALYEANDYKDYTPYNYGYEYILTFRHAKTNAFSIGYKTLGAGNKTALVCVTTRGTTTLAEVLGDYFKGDPTALPGTDTSIYHDIYEYEEKVWKELTSYFNSHNNFKNFNRVILLIQGHSLGGACANALTARINGYIKTTSGSWVDKLNKGDVFCYTYGAIKTIPQHTNIQAGYENIHNIYNYFDDYGPNGSMAISNVGHYYYKFGHTDMFYQNYNGDNHNIANYRDAIENNYIKTGCTASEHHNAKAPLFYYTQDGQAGTHDFTYYDVETYISETPSTRYDPRLAAFAATIANAAGTEGDLVQTLAELGISESHYETYWYDVANEEKDLYAATPFTAFSIADKTMADGNSLIYITVRGTRAIDLGSGKDEWLDNLINLGTTYTDGSGEHQGFRNCADEVIAQLSKYVASHNIDLGNAKLLITGHSRGAAAANLAAVSLNSSKAVKKSNLYCYTLACPDTACYSDSAWKQLSNKNAGNNIFNLADVRDPVSYVPGLLGDSLLGPNVAADNYWNKLGNSYWFCWDATSADFTQLNVKAHYPYNYWAYFASSPDASSLPTLDDLHGRKELTVLLNSFTPNSIKLNGLGKLYHVSGPANVVITDKSGNQIASVINGEVNYYDTEPGQTLISVTDNESAVFIGSNAEYSVKLVGTGKGNATLEIYDASLYAGSVTQNTAAFYTNIALTNRKTIQADVFGSPDPKDITFYVTDENSGSTVAKLNTDGSETTVATAQITSTAAHTSSQTATLALEAENGISGYYWGTNSNYTKNQFYPVASAPTTATAKKAVSAKGTYYLTVKDVKGNVSRTVSLTYYAITFTMPITDEPDAVILMAKGTAFALPDFKKEGYWYVLKWQQSGAAKEYSAGDTYTVTNDAKLIACDWYGEATTMFAIDYNPNIQGYTDSPFSFGQYIGKPLTVQEAPTLITDEWVFTGWNTKADGSGTAYQPGDTYSGTVYNEETENYNLPLYAQWVLASSIIHNKDAVVNVAEAVTLDYRTQVTVTVTATGIEEGYHLELTVAGLTFKGDREKAETIALDLRSDLKYTVKVVKDADGTVQDDLTKESVVYCNRGFFKRLVAIFKALFGNLPTYTVKPKK